MALAAFSSMRTDTSAPREALTAALIAAPCILGSLAAWPSLNSSPSTLLCSIGSSSHSLEVSSAPGDATQKSTSHLKASAAVVLSSRRQPHRARAQTAACLLLKEMKVGKRLARQLAVLAGIGSSQPCKCQVGYMVHPAAADSSLHLGAVPGTRSKGPSRVPVGFGAYRAGTAGEASAKCQDSTVFSMLRRDKNINSPLTGMHLDAGLTCTGSSMWAIASPLEVDNKLAGASAVSSAWCQSDAAFGSSLSLQGLISKPLGTSTVLSGTDLKTHVLFTACRILDIVSSTYRALWHLRSFTRQATKDRLCCFDEQVVMYA